MCSFDSLLYKTTRTDNIIVLITETNVRATTVVASQATYKNATLVLPGPSAIAT